MDWVLGLRTFSATALQFVDLKGNAHPIGLISCVTPMLCYLKQHFTVVLAFCTPGAHALHQLVAHVNCMLLSSHPCRTTAGTNSQALVSPLFILRTSRAVSSNTIPAHTPLSLSLSLSLSFSLSLSLSLALYPVLGRQTQCSAALQPPPSFSSLSLSPSFSLSLSPAPPPSLSLGACVSVHTHLCRCAGDYHDTVLLGAGCWGGVDFRSVLSLVSLPVLLHH